MSRSRLKHLLQLILPASWDLADTSCVQYFDIYTRGASESHFSRNLS